MSKFLYNVVASSAGISAKDLPLNALGWSFDCGLKVIEKGTKGAFISIMGSGGTPNRIAFQDGILSYS